MGGEWSGSKKKRGSERRGESERRGVRGGE